MTVAEIFNQAKALDLQERKELVSHLQKQGQKLWRCYKTPLNGSKHSAARDKIN